MLSSEIYLRLKPYLAVKITSDIVTEHCCQVRVLYMMFCRSDYLLCADMVSDYYNNRNPALGVLWFWHRVASPSIDITIQILGRSSLTNYTKATKSIHAKLHLPLLDTLHCKQKLPIILPLRLIYHAIHYWTISNLNICMWVSQRKNHMSKTNDNGCVLNVIDT